MHIYIYIYIYIYIHTYTSIYICRGAPAVRCFPVFQLHCRQDGEGAAIAYRSTLRNVGIRLQVYLARKKHPPPWITEGLRHRANVLS